MTCGVTVLTCDADQRLAILNVRHAYHVAQTKFQICPAQVKNCSYVPEVCCRAAADPPSSADCLEPYDQTTLLDVHRRCSGIASTSGGNVTCDVQLPPLPQVSSGACSNLSGFQNASSYSIVDYACINDSDVSSFCSASGKNGNLLYTMWTPQNVTVPGEVNHESCKCRVTSSRTPATDVFVRIMDLRLPSPGDRENCSYITVADAYKTYFRSSCSNSTMLFDPAFRQNDRITARTPFDVTLLLNAQHVPDMVWLGFSGDLKVDESSDMSEESNAKDGVNAAAVIGGSGAALAVVVLAGFACVYFCGKRVESIHGIPSHLNCEPNRMTASSLNFTSRRKETAARKREQSWWEKIREEDRIAELSQLGPATAVVIDDRRNMGYGKHRPTRDRYKTSDFNPPIYVIPGNAAPRANIIEITDNDVEEGSGEVVGSAGDRHRSDLEGDVSETDEAVVTVHSVGADGEGVVSYTPSHAD
ncbi:hypothetical protein BaRGS_00026485 [Batillaria attramentaria]|uniref:Uncharacterized protein n=1 Tax=Batillaria attramentaria TaxID=370345 RepID=A0ABD0K484_9CAEN